MKKDFKKLLCEGHRHKDWDRGKGKKKAIQKASRGDYDEWSHPSLKPLVRYLRKNVGRKWDDVYSEIKETCPSSGSKNINVDEYLWWYVERHAQFIDGKVYESPKHSYKRQLSPLTDSGRDNSFYIDQKGFLRRPPKVESWSRRYRRQKEEKRKNGNVRELNGVWYVRKKGIWYETKTVPLPKPYTVTYERDCRYRGSYTVKETRWPIFRDVFLGIDGWSYVYDRDARRCIDTYGKRVYCTQLRQLNTRELRRLNLKK
jgi:hypothetical protein